jgi:hypothetical protein
MRSFFSHDLSLGSTPSVSQSPSPMKTPSVQSLQVAADRRPMQMPPQSINVQVK